MGVSARRQQDTVAGDDVGYCMQVIGPRAGFGTHNEMTMIISARID
jgi:hypothetical protein